MFKLFITTAPGLEAVLEKEIQALGYTPYVSQAKVELQVSNLEDIYRLNLSLRSASRVLVEILSFKCRNQEDLYKNTLAFDWYPFFQKMPSFAISANIFNNPAFNNSLFVSQKMKDAICDALREKCGKRPSVDLENPEI